MLMTSEKEIELRWFDEFRSELHERGWSILRHDAISADPAETLRRIGPLIPQYNGNVAFDVTYKKGFDDAPYSQSMNGLGAHTEAPGYEPPPKYLALYCHRQARCGSGHTLLADGIRFYNTALSKELRNWAETNPVSFVADASPGSDERQSLHARIRVDRDGETLLRFSYNLFRYGNVNPSAEDVSNAAGEPQGPLARIADEGNAWFGENLTSVLIPDGCMLVWNNHRLIHGRGQYSDSARHLTRYWIG